MAGTGVGKFSSTAGNNTGNMTVNFAENMAPSNVNNAARELMGHIYDMYKQIGDGYFEFGDGDATYTVARSDADTITITSSSDISSVYFPGRKIRITDGGANVVEGTIASSSHSSTTQTVNLTGISLASGTPTKVELGIDTAAFGGRIILDDDGDTYIEAPTDDTIDIYVGGAKDFVITANTFTAESGSTIAAQALTATTIAATSTVTGTSFNGIPFYQGDTGSIYTHDVSGTDDTAQYNTAYGLTALDAITTADNTVAIGYAAAGLLTTGGQGIYIGSLAGGAGTITGASNNVIGYQAGKNLDSGHSNVLIGDDAGRNLTTANNLVMIGHNVGNGFDTETHNLAIGTDALGGSVAGGEFNVAVGNYSLDAVTSGDSNTALGYQAGTAINSGSNNVMIGYQAGDDITTGSGVVNIGDNTDNGGNVNHSIVIGQAASGKGANTGFISPNGGAVFQGNNSTTWSQTSDIRIKKNIKDNNIGLEKINKIKVRNFEYKLPEEITEVPTHAAIKKEGVQLGVIAQEIQEVLPDTVVQTTHGVYSVNPDNITWYLVNAVQELSATVTTLQQEINTLKGE
tara:strand:+ start:16269 stop:17987 length:1719 start_codon:yes stop_codon:yes gene_type:complete